VNLVDLDITGANNPPLAELLAQATSSSNVITLSADGQKRVVLLSLELFEQLVGLKQYSQKELMPANQFQQEFHRALVSAGYDTRQKIIDLVQDVKREIATEQWDGLTANQLEPMTSHQGE